MAVQKVLYLNTNNQAQQITPNTSSAGVGDAGKLVALNAAGQIDSSMLPSSEALTFTATEAIAQGAFVNVYNNSGSAAVRNANATDATKPANGWAPNSIATSSAGTINFDGINSYVNNSGFVAADLGTEAFLSTTAGGAVQYNNTFSTGNLVESLGNVVGWATSTLAIAFSPQIRAIF